MMHVFVSLLLVVNFIFVALLPLHAADDAGFNEQVLSDIVKSKTNQSVIDTGFLPPPTPVQISDPPQPMLDIDALCYGKGFCILVPASDEQKVMPQFALDFIQSFSNYGSPLTGKETENAGKAFEALNNTAFGQKICANLTGGNCSVESLASKGITIQTRASMEKDFAAKTIVYAGKILIVTNRQPKYSNQNSLFWAKMLAHELSHAEDYKIFKRSLDKMFFETETKAFLSELAAYNELKARYPNDINDPIMNFLIEVWAWKENNGPYPKDFVYNGKLINAKDFINKIINPSRKGTDAVRNITTKFYYDENLPYPVMINPSIQYYEFIKNLEMRGIEYNKWRINNPSLANPANQQYQQPQQPQQPQSPQLPQQPQQPESPSHGNNSGGGGGPGGEWVPPFNPNPHF